MAARNAAARERQRKYMRELRARPGYREKEREWKRANRRKMRAANRAYIRKLKASSPCADCGCHFPPAELDFHHSDPATKFQGIARVVVYSRSRMLKELEKCVLLCRACHMGRHYPKGDPWR